MAEFSGISSTIRLDGYVSEFASPHDEWPATYVIVRVEPEAWTTTLPLDDLIAILDGDTGVALRGIPYRWEAEDLTVELGPVHLSGNTKEWRMAARDLLGVAGSAQALYEAPGYRPWEGSTAPLPVRELHVEGGGLVGECSNTPTAQLAAVGGFSVDEFVDIFGDGWRVGEGQHFRESLLFDDPVLLWGQPAQLAAQSGAVGLRIGLPTGSWGGPGGFVSEIQDDVLVAATMPRPVIESFVKDLLRRRRRTFTWCRSCGDLLAPEHRHDRETCYGCADTVY